MGNLPDRGYSASKALGLLLVGYVVWMLSVLGYLLVDRGGILVGIGAIAVLSALSSQRVGNGSSRPSLLRWGVRNWATVALIEAVFLISFGVWAYVRALNPEIIATEKPMEFAFLNAVAKSGSMPPHDPWLSGYSISYYYFGYVIMSALITITGVVPAVGFNLGIALLFGLASVGAFGVLLNLVLVRERAGPRLPDNTRGVARFLIPAGLASAYSVIAGNLNGLLEAVHQRGIGAAAFWSWLGIKWIDTGAVPSETWMPQRYLWWWQSSRVIRDIDLSGNPIALQPIGEFPFFSFLLGDMHPHVLALPFSFLCMMLALDVFLEARLSKGTQSGLSVPRLIYCSVVLGALGFLNMWDFPVYLFITVAAFFVGGRVAQLPRRTLWLRSGSLGASLLALGIVLYLPFYIGFRSQAGGLLPNPVFVTRLPQFLVMFWPVVVPTFAWVIWSAIASRQSLSWHTGLLTGPGVLGALVIVCVSLTAIIVALPEQGEAELLSGLLGDEDLRTAYSLVLRRRLVESPWANLSISAILLLIGAQLGARMKSYDSRNAGDNADSLRQFVLIIAGCGSVLVLIPDFVYIRDAFGVRLNTVFKLYYQAWVLWSIAGAYGAWRLCNQTGRLARIVFTCCLGLVIAGSMVYPTMALWTKTNGFQGTTYVSGKPIATLDGMAHLATSQPDDYNAIQWLSRNSRASDVIAEAVGGSYSQYARISTHTGIPTVMGWPGHELQWRGGFSQAAGREKDVETLYSTRSWSKALALLEKYSITYVYVGDLELATYPGLSVEKFGKNMATSYQDGKVTIYSNK